MALNSLILILFLIIFNIFFYKYFLLMINKRNPKLFIDDQFRKPQAFHQSPVSVLGGSCIFFSFTIMFLYFFLIKEVVFFEYFSICTLFFLLGFVDDLKININPLHRLTLMIVFLVALVKYNSFYLENTGIDFLNTLILNSEIFSLIFICLCFLFIINGANLIDGYNGLLGMHSLIILINLFLINFVNENNDLANLLLFIIIIILLFLKFNFPKANVFLGDSGSYFIGAFIAISVIKTSIDNPTISPFYFCILLFYLFFEVFFSFLRKIVKEKISPIYPDKKHLHMLLYEMLLKKNHDKFKSNYSVSIIINSIYFIFTIPAIFMMDNGIFCKYYSIILFITYIFSYKKIYGKIKQRT